ncbi:MAG TPA: biotin/lipoyl-containing protein, partial [Nitriliruptorales bacterium]|nr:biotin/lipoyl-containing protein [Nitriliruptorales bacterium]
RLEVAGGCHDVRVVGAPRPDATVALEVDGRHVEARVAVTDHDGRSPDGDQAVWVHTWGTTTRLAVVRPAHHVDPGAAAAAATSRSPMPGTVAAVHATVGDRVASNAVVAVIEAMKMQHPVRAPSSGTVTAVHVAVGDAVEADQQLVDLRPDRGDRDAERGGAGPGRAPERATDGSLQAPGATEGEPPASGATEGEPRAPGHAPPGR